MSTARWVVGLPSASYFNIFAQLGHVPHEEDAAQTVAAVQQFLK